MHMVCAKCKYSFCWICFSSTSNHNNVSCLKNCFLRGLVFNIPILFLMKKLGYLNLIIKTIKGYFEFNSWKDYILVVIRYPYFIFRMVTYFSLIPLLIQAIQLHRRKERAKYLVTGLFVCDGLAIYKTGRVNEICSLFNILIMAFPAIY